MSTPADEALRKAADMDPTWPQRAYAALRLYARMAYASRRLFTVEQARQEAPHPPDGCDMRAWGAITRAAIRDGVIEATRRYAPAKSSNGSDKRLYRGVNPKRWGK